MTKPDANVCRYIGDNIKLLIERADGTYCFRLHKDRFARFYIFFA